MNIFESPGKTVVDRSATKKTILITVYNSEYDFLESIRPNFSDQLQAAVKKCDRPKVINTFRRINLGDQSDKTCINAFQIKATLMKLVTKKIEVIFNDWPTCF